MTPERPLRARRTLPALRLDLGATIYTRVSAITLTLCLGGGYPILAQNPSATGTTPPPATPIPALSDRPLGRPATGSPDQNGPVKVDKAMFDQARSISEPAERSFALERLARTAITAQQLDEGQEALIEALEAARLIQQPLIHDQRISAIIVSALRLAEQLIREGTPDDPTVDPSSPVVKPPPTDQATRLQRALAIWNRTLDVSRELNSDTTRTETIYRIVDSQSFSSQNLGTNPTGQRYGAKPDRAGLSAELRKYTDLLLVEASEHAMEIDRPLWRDRALILVVSNAAVSAQFERGLQIARMIPQAEARVDALIRIAENQATQDKANDATQTYAEAAQAVASIPQDDPREILNNVLIDSLISVGRFDDARACVVIFQNDQRKVLALSAVAESQGRRGLMKSAQEWIAREPSVELRSILLRRLSEGIAGSIEQNRSKQQLPYGVQ